MTGDRFGDLGGEDRPEERRSAGERLEERDRTHPEPGPRPPEHRRPSSRYAWVVGIAFFVVVAIATLNSLPNEGAAIRGPKPRSTLPAFAAPLATAVTNADAKTDVNLCQRSPCPGQTGSRPACEVDGQVLNLCELRKKPLVLTFVFDRAADCFPQVDRVERMMGSVPGVNFATVYFSRKDADEVRTIVRRRGWKQPVGWDHDGQLSNLYRTGGCPTTVFAYKGGKVRRTELGLLSEDQLREKARALIREPKRS